MAESIKARVEREQRFQNIIANSLSRKTYIRQVSDEVKRCWETKDRTISPKSQALAELTAALCIKAATDRYKSMKNSWDDIPSQYFDFHGDPIVKIKMEDGILQLALLALYNDHARAVFESDEYKILLSEWECAMV